MRFLFEISTFGSIKYFASFYIDIFLKCVCDDFFDSMIKNDKKRTVMSLCQGADLSFH